MYDPRPRAPAAERGSVTAEFALTLTAAVLVLAVSLGALGAFGRLVRLQSAVADAARLASRGEPAAVALAVLDRAVPGARGDVADQGDLVCVTARAGAPGPASLALPDLRAHSCALSGGR